MAKIKKESNWRVIVEPHLCGQKEGLKCKSECESIMADVKRHVDNVQDVYLDCDIKYICGFCGCEWEANEDPLDPDYELGEPICCARAQEEFHKLKEQGIHNVVQ